VAAAAFLCLVVQQGAMLVYCAAVVPECMQGAVLQHAGNQLHELHQVDARAAYTRPVTVQVCTHAAAANMLDAKHVI
jgi:hypothetical protein